MAALAAFHPGHLVTDDADSPHQLAGNLRAELYLGIDDDLSMTREQIAMLERALDDAGVRYRAEIYDGAYHGFTTADVDVFDEAARERHFRELHALLERTLHPSAAGSPRVATLVTVRSTASRRYRYRRNYS